MFFLSIRDVLCKVRINICKEIIKVIYYVNFIWSYFIVNNKYV